MDHSQLPEPGSSNTGHYAPQENASTWMTHQQFFNLKNMHDLSMGMAGEDFSVLKQFNFMENHSTVTSGTSEQSKKRNASSMEMAVHDQDVHKRLRLETCGMNDQVISTFNEEGSMDLDSEMDISETSSLIELSNSRLTGSNPLSLSKNQVFQGHNYASNTSYNYEQNNAMNTNIFQNEIVAGETSLPKSSNVHNVCSVEDMQALPGPSRFREIIPQLNFHPEKLRYRTPQSVVETPQDPSMCFLCKKKISEHWDSLHGIEFYSCCVCQRSFREKNSIPGHISLHCSVVSYSESKSESSSEMYDTC